MSSESFGMVSAGDIGVFRGGSGFPVRFQGLKSGELPFFKVSDMNRPGNELFMVKANNYVSEEVRASLGATRIPAGAIVFAKVGAAVYLERKRVLAQDSCIDNNMAAFIVDQSSFDVRFLHYLLSAFKLSSLVATTALPSLNGVQLRSIPLLMPSTVTEQREIASIVSNVDMMIASLERLIAKKRSMKQGIMQQLLTGKTRLPGFSGEWHSKRLSELLAYEQPGRYLVSSTDYVKTGIPVLTAGKTFLLGYTIETGGIYEALPVIIFDDFTTASKYVSFPFKAKSSAMKMLSAKPGADLRFVFERMQQIDFVVADHKRRWIAEFSKIEIAVPPIEEQHAISSVSEDTDDEIDALERRICSIRAIKHGMIQELLTGRTRLVPAEVGA